MRNKYRMNMTSRFHQPRAGVRGTDLARKQKRIGVARSLRQRNVPAEALLWRALRNRALGGFKFRRQHPVGPYIVDFACIACKRAVELDGATHLAIRRADGERSRKIRAGISFVFGTRMSMTILSRSKKPSTRNAFAAPDAFRPPSPRPSPPADKCLQRRSHGRRGERGKRGAAFPDVIKVRFSRMNPFFPCSHQAQAFLCILESCTSGAQHAS